MCLIVHWVTITVSRAVLISECICADLWFPLVLLGIISHETVGYQIQVCTTLCQGCSYTRRTWYNLDSLLVLRSAEVVYSLLWNRAACGCQNVGYALHEKALKAQAIRIVKVNTGVAETREKSALGLMCGCIPSHIAQGVVTLRLGRADGLSKADVLFCPIRLMYVPSEETTVLRSRITPPLHLHHHPLFLCLGACLLNPASGRWPGHCKHTVQNMLKAHGTNRKIP